MINRTGLPTWILCAGDYTVLLRRLASFNICKKLQISDCCGKRPLLCSGALGGSIKKKDTSHLDKIVRKQQALSRLLSIMHNPLHPLYKIISRLRSNLSDKLVPLPCYTTPPGVGQIRHANVNIPHCCVLYHTLHTMHLNPSSYDCTGHFNFCYFCYICNRLVNFLWG